MHAITFHFSCSIRATSTCKQILVQLQLVRCLQHIVQLLSHRARLMSVSLHTCALTPSLRHVVQAELCHYFSKVLYVYISTLNFSV